MIDILANSINYWIRSRIFYFGFFCLLILYNNNTFVFLYMTVYLSPYLLAILALTNQVTEHYQ